jgi:aspartate-semialdehyde dehydrogenase
MDPRVPLIVPEVNPDAVHGYDKLNIIANPNCSTAQLVVALKPLHDRATIKRVVVATYQSVSGAGKDAMDELWNQTKKLYVNDEIVPEAFPKQIAFNVIPHGGDFMEDGSTTEEWKIEVETKKILDPKIKLTATSVRVPVFVGHSEAVNIEFEQELEADEARELLRESPGIMVIDKHEDGGYATPIDCVGEFATFVSRIRNDKTVENGLVVLRAQAFGDDQHLFVELARQHDALVHGGRDPVEEHAGTAGFSGLGERRRGSETGQDNQEAARKVF